MSCRAGTQSCHQCNGQIGKKTLNLYLTNVSLAGQTKWYDLSFRCLVVNDALDIYCTAGPLQSTLGHLGVSALSVLAS